MSKFVTLVLTFLFVAICPMFSTLPGQGLAADCDKLAFLKKIEGSWIMKCSVQTKETELRTVNFRVDGDTLVITDHLDGLPPFIRSLRLEDVEEDNETVSFRFYPQRFKRPVRVPITRDGDILPTTKGTGDWGLPQEISFTRS